MAPVTWRVYTTCLTLVMLCVLATYHGAVAAKRCVRTSGDTLDVEEFQSASPSTIKKILEAYFQNRRASKPTYNRPIYTCVPQGDSCSPTGKTPCCGRMGCYKYNGEKCARGSRCVCRNPQYSIDPGF
ncbi:uncharacterized protein LOC115928543 [Strongylocentrotus purpuratus]|uniref:Uncharacterized protein n=1 Tax=Strongylocentrotus purpuratus TaxID=7668 RepID=A0A7M7PHW5_STRPU|nr:uncharacterized protein LOC105445263 [Strongylocentrotus purpuratus]XP_030851708.1 uncharacterized protein LOC115928543 [Strongylocentrotus purpuratus]|eukprot:XP_011678884.1 PREDICTED: uncharacterized protein LOC105445263 [Strongylocentrotus purpuratus]